MGVGEVELKAGELWKLIYVSDLKVHNRMQRYLPVQYNTLKHFQVYVLNLNRLQVMEVVKFFSTGHFSEHPLIVYMPNY